MGRVKPTRQSAAFGDPVLEAKPHTRIALRDLGWVNGVRVHVVEAGFTGRRRPPLEALLRSLHSARPQAETILVPAVTHALEPAAVREALGDAETRVLVASPGSAPHWSPSLRDDTVRSFAVSYDTVNESFRLMAQMALGRVTYAGAVALAGLWNAGEELGRDVIVVLGEVSAQQQAVAA